jgi:von Willebrand factor type A C-terminal domain/von Willebrand factor type A domain
VKPTFSLKCSYNRFLPDGGSEVNAIVTMAPESSHGVGWLRSGGAEVIILDVSGSMEGFKMQEARTATIAAIEGIAEGIPFGVIAGNESAIQIYPAVGLVPANRRTRAEANRSVGRLKASGGTAIGEWISLAARLLESVPGFRHAILLTDGKDEHETPEALAAALTSASSVFQCDCRGVGTDWSVSELRQVATALLGSVEIVADPAELSADFQNVMRQAMGRGLADVRLRIWVPKGAEILTCKQVAPELLDLTGVRARPDELSWEFSTGAWGPESRDYHVRVRVQPASIGDEVLAARIAVVVDREEVGRSTIRATWTDDRARSTRVNRQVAHYTGQEELADAIQVGLDALNEGDEVTAVGHLGRAVRIAAATGNTSTGELLAAVVDVEDAATGRVHLKVGVTPADVMTLDTRSTRTARVQS